MRCQPGEAVGIRHHINVFSMLYLTHMTCRDRRNGDSVLFGYAAGWLFHHVLLVKITNSAAQFMIITRNRAVEHFMLRL